MPHAHQPRTAVYAGSFDPITNGHLWVIQEAAGLVDRLIVALGVNPDKRATFTATDRLAMLREATAHLPNVAIAEFPHQYLVRYAASVGARWIVRGLRNDADYAAERMMRHVNEDIDASITALYLLPPRHLAEVSSSLVRGLVGVEGWEDVVRRYVPPSVHRRFVERELRGRWVALWERMALDGDPDAPVARLMAMHAEGTRAYHTAEHVAAVLRALDGARELAADPDVLAFALFCHDAVYDAAAPAGENEQRSADLAAGIARAAGMPRDRIEAVRLRVLATRHPATPLADSDDALTADLDLEVLAAPAPRYDAYAAAVGLEYATAYERPAYARGRRSFLAGMLDRPAIYRTPALRGQWEAAARANIAREIGALDAEIGAG